MSGSGLEAVAMFYALRQDAFPDNQVRTVAVFEDGSTGVLQAVFEGTHTATLNAPGQPIAATGKRVSLPFVNVSSLTEGKVAAFTLYFDRAELMAQLGLVPAPA
jgi:predicted ester cyclase